MLLKCLLVPSPGWEVPPAASLHLLIIFRCASERTLLSNTRKRRKFSEVQMWSLGGCGPFPLLLHSHSFHLLPNLFSHVTTTPTLIPQVPCSLPKLPPASPLLPFHLHSLDPLLFHFHASFHFWHGEGLTALMLSYYRLPHSLPFSLPNLAPIYIDDKLPSPLQYTPDGLKSKTTNFDYPSGLCFTCNPYGTDCKNILEKS